MAISFLEGFEPYGGADGKIGGPPFASADLKVSDECSYIGPDLKLIVDRLPDGKWLLHVNGVEMIFERRPEFSILRPSE